MADVAHQWGGDLSIGPSGDIASVQGPSLNQQRVLRRLLTNGGGYIWHLTYGAGLPERIGEPGNALRIAALIRSQIFAEAAVAASPEPSVDVASTQDGTVSVQLRYTDATTAETQLLQFSLDM